MSSLPVFAGSTVRENGPPRPLAKRAVRVIRRVLPAPRALLVLAAVLRVVIAIWDQGLVWPDEIFQTLEQAHRFAFGQGIIPWEFRDGARSWLYPGIIGLAWKGAAAVGVTSPLTLVRLAKLAMAAASVSAVWAGMRLARLLGGARAELLAGVIGALLPAIVIFGCRCTTETASAPLIVWTALLLEQVPSRRREALAGTFMGIAVLFRYQNGLAAAAFVLVLLARRRWKGTLVYLAGGAVIAVLGGILDWKTWGSPFHPLVVYVKFNTAAGGADRWGTSPFTFFSDNLATSGGLSYAILLLGFGVAALGSARGLGFVVALFIAAHSQVPHKELRFITPVLPLAAALAAVGLARLMDGLRRGPRPTYVLAAALTAQMAWQLREPKLRDLGYDDDDVVWHANEDYYQATLDAADAPDLCGISYIDNPHAWTSGYTYLHRHVPVFFDVLPRNLAAANYLVAGVDTKPPTGWTKLTTHGKYALYHREGPCGPIPSDWTLDEL